MLQPSLMAVPVRAEHRNRPGWSGAGVVIAVGLAAWLAAGIILPYVGVRLPLAKA